MNLKKQQIISKSQHFNRIKMIKTLKSCKMKRKIDEFEDPGELFDFIVSNSEPKANSKINAFFIDEINSIIEIMTKILYTPPYPILFGRLSIVKPKEKTKSTQIAIDQSFYDGFGFEFE